MDWYTIGDNEQPVLLADDQRYSVDAHKVWPPLKTTVDGYEVSTVFLGLDHGYAADFLPVLWETMIFGDGPVPWASGDDNEYQERYTSADAARMGHDQTVQRLRDKIADMTPRTDPATPEEMTMPGKPITDEPWRILSEWIGSGSYAHAAMTELEDAGYVIVDKDDLIAAAHYVRHGARGETGHDLYHRLVAILAPEGETDAE